MAPKDELISTLKKLRLSGFLATLDLRIKEAVDQGLSHGEFLERLLDDEVARRDGKQLDVRLRRASFEGQKRLEDFEWAFNPGIPRARIIELATCAFVERQENVLLVGPTGVGKSHIAQSLGERACRAGYSVLYVPTHRMLTALRASRADRSYEKRLARYMSPDVLILDDVGLRPLEAEEPIDLYEVIRGRYERGSTILTSNRAVDEWYPLFKDELIASAAMDRLLHRSHVLVMEGHSYRNPPKAKKSA